MEMNVNNKNIYGQNEKQSLPIKKLKITKKNEAVKVLNKYI